MVADSFVVRVTVCAVLYVPLGTDGVVTGTVMSLKVAVTFLELSMTTVQILPLTSAQPDQEVKVELASATAVRVREVPYMNVVEQVLPQSIPPRLEVTVPLPVPELITLSASIGFEWSVKAAVTLFA